MKTNIEIEFKTFITKEKYDYLIGQFDLEGNIFSQVNYYFDTANLDLLNANLVLRIRKKGSFYKLTSKSHSDNGAYETHILLDEDEALNMIQNGFDANIIGINHFVKNICALQTDRVSTPYKDGVVFFDKSSYYGKVDYEIEYEVDSYKEGKVAFKAFLDEFDIPSVPSIRKSYRAYSAFKEIQNK